MANTAIDRNGMTAQGWKAAALDKPSVASNASNPEIYEKLKAVFADALQTSFGDSSDDKYRMIVDLLAARVQAATADIDDSKLAQISAAVAETISNLPKQDDTALYGAGSNYSDVPTPAELADVALSFIQTSDLSGCALSCFDMPRNDGLSQTGAGKTQTDMSSEEGFSACELKCDRIISTLQKMTNGAVTSLPEVAQPKQKNADVLVKDGQKLFGGNKSGGIIDAVAPPAVKSVEVNAGKQLAILGMLSTNTSIFSGAILKSLKKLAANTRPKSLIERFVDWCFKKAMKRASTNFIKKLIFGDGGESRIFGKKGLFGRSKFGQKLKKVFKPITDKLKKFIDIIKAKAKTFASNISEGITKIKKRITAIYKMVKRGIHAIWKVLKRIYDKTVKPIFRFIRKMLGKLWRFIKFMFGVLRNIFTLIGRFLKFIGRQLWKAFDKFVFRHIRNFFKNIVGKFKNIGKYLKNFANGLKSKIFKIGSKVKDFFGKAKSFFKNAKKKLVQSLKNVATKLKNAFKKIAMKIKDKIVGIIKKIAMKTANFVKGMVTKIMKRLVFGAVKKAAKKQAAKFGLKFLIKWFTKFFVKLIAKFTAKILASAAVNAIPILGQVISVCMMIWSIVDFIIQAKQIYDLFNEHPQLMDALKESVAQWAEKAFNFMKGLCEAGKKLFKAIFIDGPKKIGHFIGDALFSTDEVCNREKETNKMLLDLCQMRTARMLADMRLQDRLVYMYKIATVDFPARYSHFVTQIETFNNKVASEQDSWWRSTDLIIKLMNERQPMYKGILQLLNGIGLFFSDVYSGELLNYGSRISEIAHALKMKIEAERDREDNAFLNHVKTDFGKLAEQMKELDKPQNEGLDAATGFRDALVRKYEGARDELVSILESAGQKCSVRNDGLAYAVA